jgi:hypothetical protein
MRVMIDTGKVAGTLGLAGGVLVLCVALARAVLVDPVPLPEAGPAVGLEEQDTSQVLAAEPSLPPTLSRQAITRAAGAAPFDPERQPPTQRYRLPGELMVEASESSDPDEGPPVPQLRLLGTIAGPGGGIAVIQEGGERPRVLAIGQTIAGYQVAAVQEEAVTMSSGGWEISLKLEEGNMAVAVNQNRSNRRDMSRQELETFVRAMQQRFGGAGYQIQTEGGRVYLVRPDGTRMEIQLPGAAGRGGRGNTRIPPQDQPEWREDVGTSEGGY